MDKRKDTLSSLKICRFCLTQDVPMASLYDKKRKMKSAVNLPLKILSCVSVEVFPSDKMPTYICERCKYFMNLCYDFKQICRQADEAILHYIQDNKPVKPIAWPVSLNDAYRESNEIGVVKTVVDGGTTVQVTHDMSDTEDEDDENIYNVKINDGSDEVSKTCIKVVASRDNDEKLDNKGSTEQCWPCDDCSCAYPLQQMLELHRMRKHRKRNVKCDECDDTFFTKYDLAIHQLRHSVDMPYKCAACDKDFKRMILLKRHEKLIHPELVQQACPLCPASFLSTADLDAHRDKHERPHACVLCDKKFLEKSTLQRHIQVIHNRILHYACEYCPQRESMRVPPQNPRFPLQTFKAMNITNKSGFASITKLSKHLRSHAGERPYPCKYCNKSFMKSHHYTRHVRVKHRDEERGRMGPGDSYRCEQCDVSFRNQDELIYHSAIHATQNLTCPLCQEKFDNVDAVTAHIKSHVNGMEFMCDFCELVFTTKEKLDHHTMLSHEEEIQNEMEQDESSMEAEDMEGDDEYDDSNINVKEEDDHMVVEIKKAGDFLLKNQKSMAEEKIQDKSNSEDSDSERTIMEPVGYEKLATVKKIIPANIPVKEEVVKQIESPLIKSGPQVKPSLGSDEKYDVRKPEEITRGSIVQRTPGWASPVEKKEKHTMAQVTKIETANDKSLRLLEKELQDLKRTNSRSEAVKTPPVKVIETPRGRGRPPLHTSTPKIKPPEEKKPVVVQKPPTLEKKPLERKIITKENKEPKVVKEIKPNIIKEDKDTNNKIIIKNGTNDKSVTDEGIRRSTRPSKIKDYAKMIRVNTQDDSDSDELDDDDDEYKEGERSADMLGRIRARRNSVRPQKSSPAPTPVLAPGTQPRKRGRPRKEQPKDVPLKIKKTQEPEAETEPEPELEEEQEPINDEVNKSPAEASSQATVDTKQDDTQDSVSTEPEQDTEVKSEEPVKQESLPITCNEEKKSPNVDQEAPHSPSKIISPTGQSLKKVPMRSLPPGVKPLPLPLVGRNLPSGELCEMQIGKKVVKVQKIIMTKAEVEAMAKKGLVEMKDGTMVLKQGVKLPKVESVVAKGGTAGGGKDSLARRDRPVPTRCDLGDE